MTFCDPILCKTILNSLVFFYKLTPQSIGISIIVVTIGLRLLLAPMLSKSLKNAQTIKDLAPQINKLKKRHKNDKKKFMEAQSELYKQKGINPAAGCLPQIFQIVLLFGFFGALSNLLRADSSRIQSLLFSAFDNFDPDTINTHFLYLDLSSPDIFSLPNIPLPIPGPLLIAAVVVQFISSKLMLPKAEAAQKQAAKTKGQMDDILASSQQQMIYIFPLMTLIIGVSFPSGLVLYWFTLSLFQIFFQDLISPTSKIKTFVSNSGLIKYSKPDAK